MLTIDSTHTALKCCIQDYFSTFNSGDYYDTGLLFAPTGQLLPPFEDVIQGQDAIAYYLDKEATGMLCTPTDILIQSAHQAKASGYVKTSLFQVSVVWHFTFDADQQIIQLKVTLVASLQELLPLQNEVSLAS